MYIVIKTKELVEGLQKVTKAVSSTSAMDVLKGIKIVATHEALLLTGSDSSTSIESRIPASQEKGVCIEKTGGVILPMTFVDVVKRLGDEITVSVNERYTATIKSNNPKIKAEIQLNGLDPEMYPRLPEINEKPTLSISGKDFLGLIQKTVFATAQEEKRPILTAILFRLKDEALTFTGTDAHRLAVGSIKVDTKEELAVPVPAKALKELAKVIEPTTVVEITITTNHFMVKNGDFVFYTRLLNGTYPDVNRIIPQGHKSKWLVSRQEMMDSLERLQLVGTDKKNQQIRMIVEGQSLSLSWQNDTAKGQEMMFISDHEGDEITISFNLRYVLESLRAMETNQVELRCVNAMSPIMIVPENAESELYLVLPLRTA
jgi:DNA polymerase III subunit beta